MPIPSDLARARLEAMDVQVWVSRETRPLPRVDADDGPRIRLASGDGDWLLVLDGPVADSCRPLLSDITAALGAERCRFGQLARSADAGVGRGEWSERGIEHVLLFGDGELDDPRVIRAPALEALAASAEARRGLWARLRPVLEP